MIEKYDSKIKNINHVVGLYNAMSEAGTKYVDEHLQEGFENRDTAEIVTNAHVCLIASFVASPIISDHMSKKWSIDLIKIIAESAIDAYESMIKTKDK
jgi:hypothetical protein